MEWVKTTAKTLPEAIDLALDNLGVDESDAEIVVLEEPRTGLFGRIKGTARVEARVKPKQSRPKQERKRNGGRNKSRNDRGGSGRNNGGGRNRSRNKSQNSGDRNRQGKGQGSGRGGQNSGGQNRGQEKQDAADASAQPMVLDAGAGGNQSEKSGGNRNAGNQDASNQNDGKSNSRSDSGNREQGGNRSRGGRNRGGNGGSGGRGKRNSEGNARSKNQTDAGPKVEAPVEDVKNHLQEFLTGLTGAFGFEGPVTVDESPEDGLTGQVAGQHGLMVGPKGRTLDAIQELARISSSRKVPSSVRIKVDVGGYRAQRAVALGQFAVKAADNAVENSVEVALDPMSAADRKAVHDALSDDDRVETRSVGTDPRRKVLVVPVSATANEDDDTSEDSSSEDESHSSDDVSSDDVSSDDVSSDEVPNEGDLVEAGTGDADE